MNYIELGFWGITALFLIFGIIMGAVRGANRSVLRLVLVLLSAVAAFFMRKWLANMILNAKWKGGDTIEQTLINFLGSNFGEMAEKLKDTIKIMVAVLSSVIIFLMTFYLLKFLTWIIVYPLCKLFVKKGKKKHPIFGAFIGLVQGAVVALCICVPLAGLVAQVNKLVAAVDSMQTSASLTHGGYYASAEEEYQDFTIGDGMLESGEGEGESGEGKEPEGEDPTVNPGGETGEGNESGTPEGGEGNESGTPEGGEGNESGTSDGNKKGSFIPKSVLDKMQGFDNSLIGKFYSKTLKVPFKWISTVEVKTTDKDGKTVKQSYTLEGQVDAIVGAVRMIKEFVGLKDINWKGDFDGDVAAQIQDVFNKLDETKGEISSEAIKTINDVAGVLLNSVGLPVDVDASQFDLNDVNFKNEGKLIVDVVDRANKEEFTSDDLKVITEDLSNSTLVMPMLENVNSSLELSVEKKAMMEVAFQELELDDENEYDQHVLDTLRKVFGLNGENGPDVPPPPQTPEISE